jgi:hypothetical protein
MRHHLHGPERQTSRVRIVLAEVGLALRRQIRRPRLIGRRAGHTVHDVEERRLRRSGGVQSFGAIRVDSVVFPDA